MEKLRSSKVTKPRATASNVNLACVEQIEKVVFQPAEPSIVDEDPFMFLNQNMFSELPVTDDFIFDTATIAQAPQQTTWPWSDTADWTLIDTPLLAQATPSSPSYQQALFPASTGLLSPQPTPQVEVIHEPAEQVRASELPTTTQTPTRTWRTFSDFSRTAFSTADGLDGKEQTAFMGLSTPGDMVSPTQSRNVHSPLATLTGSQSSFSLGRSAMPSGSDEMLPQFVSQAYGLTENVCRSEASQIQGTSGGIAGIASNGLIGRLKQVTSQQISNGQTGAGQRLVLTENNATSLTEMAGDRYIGNSSSTRSTDASAQGGLQNTTRTLLPAASSAGLSSSSLDASDQLPAAVAKAGSHVVNSAMKKQLAAAENVHHESIAATGETPSAARPSSLSADSTSASSSTSVIRTVPASPRPRPQADSPDLRGGLSAAASTPSAAVYTTAHDEDTKKLTSAAQAKVDLEGGEEDSHIQREQPRRLPLKSGARMTHGHLSAVASSTSSGDASILANSQTAALQAAAMTVQPLRHRHKRSPGQALAPATSADSGLEGTRVAAAILVAQVCAAWQAMAGAFVQTMSTRTTSCGSNDRDCPSLSVPRAVLLAA
ncbi:hypothetical protein KCU98_g9744, partial [Aureobasidium melanogenum]